MASPGEFCTPTSDASCTLSSTESSLLLALLQQALSLPGAPPLSPEYIPLLEKLNQAGRSTNGSDGHQNPYLGSLQGPSERHAPSAPFTPLQESSAGPVRTNTRKPRKKKPYTTAGGGGGPVVVNWNCPRGAAPNASSWREINETMRAGPTGCSRQQRVGDWRNQKVGLEESEGGLGEVVALCGGCEEQHIQAGINKVMNYMRLKAHVQSLLKKDHVCMASGEIPCTGVQDIYAYHVADLGKRPSYSTFSKWIMYGSFYACISGGGSLYLVFMIIAFNMKTEFERLPMDVVHQLANALRSPDASKPWGRLIMDCIIPAVTILMKNAPFSV
ncbi:hypothetical protein JAAARDRAFT_201379 [Jaapia argillacea MUCL 33604]|uniref:Uncharacterized protein n=1 Tax=Jaapia argillacea MUCL 33604 TaxID=933084 RepID=A0A067PEH4_9AGAM|nr:hypothetical protein JAAARDRAFT_201379 [Jaapia argillacea MUCL 33604]